MRELLASQKYEYTGFESASTECQEERRPIGFSARSNPYKFLHQATSDTALGVNEKSYWLVERHLHELIDRVCHSRGKEHGLSGNWTCFDYFA
jgi:hypothetical protein